MNQAPTATRRAPVAAALIAGGFLGAALLAFSLVGLAGIISTPIGPLQQHLSPADLASSAVAGATLMLAVFTAFLATETRESVAATRAEAGIAAAALEEARKSAEAADRHAEIAQETLEAGWRPLLVDVLPPENRADADYSHAGETPQGDGLDFKVRLRNIGSGPAIITRAALHTGSAGVEASRIQSSVVASGERTTLEFELRRENIQAHPVIANIKARAALTASVWYGDQGGHHRWLTRADVHSIDAGT